MDLIKQFYRAFIYITRSFRLEREKGEKQGEKQFNLSKSTCWPWAHYQVITGSGDEEIQAISPESLGNAANKVSVNDQTHCSLHTHIPARAHTHTQTDTHRHINTDERTNPNVSSLTNEPAHAPQIHTHACSHTHHHTHSQGSESRPAIPPQTTLRQSSHRPCLCRIPLHPLLNYVQLIC